MPNVERFGCRRGIQFSNTPLVIEQNSFTSKIVNAYIVYDLDNWPKIPLRIFKFKSCLLGATNAAENSDKSKLVYSGYEIAFDGKGEWNFGNYSAGNDLMFGVDKSSSSHAHNHKNDF